MKKISIAILAVCLLTSSQVHSKSDFDGFYLGVFGGHSNMVTKTHIGVDMDVKSPITLTTKNIGAKSYQKSRSHNFLYGVMAGYGTTLSNIYLGSELSVQNSLGNHQSKSHYLYMTSNNNDLQSMSKAKSSYNRGVVIFGITPRLGIVYLDSNLAYLKFGIEVSKDQIERTYTHAQVDYYKSDTKAMVSFTPGIGYEKSFDKLRLRAEYGYNIGSSMKSRKDYPGKIISMSVMQRSKYNAHEFKIGITYKI